MVNEMIKIQVSGVRESEKSIGALTDLKYDDNGNAMAGTDLVWFPKLLCTLEEEEYKRDYFGREIDAKRYFITAPKWFLEEKNIKITLK